MTDTQSWLDGAITNHHIKFVPFNEFSHVEFVAKGGYGNVRRALWKVRKKHVALKCLDGLNFNKQDREKSREAYKELVKELKIMRNFQDDDRIVRFYGLTKDPINNHFILVMQYANGGTLREYLADNFAKLSWHDKLRFALEIVSGVDCLHSENILHRDLHSKNILINNNRVLIADLGLSKEVSSSTNSTSAHSKVAGMIPYIDPKRLTRENTLPEKLSDIYSCGVLLWELSSGRIPFFNRDYDFQLLIDIFGGLRETPVPETPADYYRIYTDCWDFDFDRRPQSTDILLNRLEKVRFTPLIEIQNTEIPKNDEILSSDMVPTLPELYIPSGSLPLISHNHDQTTNTNNDTNSKNTSASLPTLPQTLTHTITTSTPALETPQSTNSIDGMTQAVDAMLCDLTWSKMISVTAQILLYLSDSKRKKKSRDKAFLQRTAHHLMSAAFSTLDHGNNGTGNQVDLHQIAFTLTTLNENLVSICGGQRDKDFLFRDEAGFHSPCSKNDGDATWIEYHFLKSLFASFFELLALKHPEIDQGIFSNHILPLLETTDARTVTNDYGFSFDGRQKTTNLNISRQYRKGLITTERAGDPYSIVMSSLRPPDPGGTTLLQQKFNAIQNYTSAEGNSSFVYHGRKNYSRSDMNPQQETKEPNNKRSSPYIIHVDCFERNRPLSIIVF